MLGRVYFIRQGETGPIKIGWTGKDIWLRRASLQGGNPETLVVLGVVEGVERSAEAEWHLRFRDLHFRAEWFLPARRLLSAIRDEAQAVERKNSRPYTPRSLREKATGFYHSAGVEVLSTWMARHELDAAQLAELTGYKPGYIEDLLAGRAPLGRESAKRFFALGGKELHPSAILADQKSRKHIRLYLARVGEAA